MKYRVSEQKSSSGKIYYRVRTGENENSSPVYESFKQDLKAAEAFAKKLNARASAKRISKLQNLTQAEAEDINYASQKLASLGGATLREAVDWYEKTKFPEAGNFTATEVGEKYIAARRKEGIRETTLTNYESKIKIFSNYFNEKLINTLNESGKMHLTHTRLNDQFIIRFSVGQTSTTLDHLKKSWDYILETVKKIEKD